jgi:hypothetical protein
MIDFRKRLKNIIIHIQLKKLNNFQHIHNLIKSVVTIDDESICDKLKTRLGAYIRRCSRGKIKEVYEVEIMIGSNIIFLTIFPGRDYYAPWAEINVVASAQDIYYVLSNVIDVANYALEKCPRIMISYVWDVKTMNLLDKGFHPATTKLGVLLISKGYYVVRDMYFPEGFAGAILRSWEKNMCCSW